MRDASSAPCAQNGAEVTSGIDPAQSACHFVSWTCRQTLRPRAGKLATGPSSRSKFSSGAAAPRSLKIFCSLQSATAAGRDDHPAADKISSARPEPSTAWKSIRRRCRICSSGSSSPTMEAARPPSISMQRCGAPISCGVHDEIGRRRIPLIQPGADPHHQRHCCCLRSGSSVHHYWHSGRGWHRRKHCRAGRLLARLRSRRRRRSRRRPAQAHPV